MMISEIISTQSGKKWVTCPCPLCGGTDRFVVKNDSAWLCRVCSPRYSDAIGLIMAVRRCDFLTAKRIADNGNSNKIELPAIQARPEIPTIDWQTVVGKAVNFCQKALLNEKNIIAYLSGRGIAQETATIAGLGYNKNWLSCSADGKCVYVPKGITIPRYNHRGTLISVNTRMFWTQDDVAEREKKGKKSPKYLGVENGGFCPYVVGRLTERTETVIIVEGEFDALLLSQFVPSGTVVITMGASTYMPSERFITALNRKQIILCMDNDDAGKMAEKKLKILFPLSTTLDIGSNKDATELWTAQGDSGMRKILSKQL